MASKVFVFFNCDAEKAEASMNIFYNNVVFKNTSISRRRLVNKIKAERKVGRIQFADEDLTKIENAVMNGNPEDAGKFITYGTVKAFECC